VSQALGFRHSHLDSGAYGFDQKEKDKDVDKAVQYMSEQENYRNVLCSMAGCLFARKAYPLSAVSEACRSLGLEIGEEDLNRSGDRIRAKRWQLRFKSGFSPQDIEIPRRYLEVENFRGKTDPKYLERLKQAWAREIHRLAHDNLD
ncbi:MAG: aldehyde ferredoxin oxidoreductase C-terminal domain-containing protein, partial [Desulfonatronovibrionaceae bacterium]